VAVEVVFTRQIQTVREIDGKFLEKYLNDGVEKRHGAEGEGVCWLVEDCGR
jgi:hypothetical protein